LPQTAPSKKPANRFPSGAGALTCPSCKGNEFTERSSFSTKSEPLLGADSASVVVDLMNCKRCGADLPAVRGRRRYTLLSDEKLATIMADLEESKRISSQMGQTIASMTRRSQELSAEIESVNSRGELMVIRERISSMEAETDGLQARRDLLARTLELVASSIPPA
jgi:septal ring factor EnvC (AmiA/AmiB activator)